VTYWVSGDTGLKQTSEAAWAGVTLTAEEIACIVPILEAVIDDASFDVWAELRPALAEAIAQTLDAAAIGGINKPASWPPAVVPAAIAAGTRPELIVAHGLAPVGITVSPPRWRLPYELAGTIGALRTACGGSTTVPSSSAATANGSIASEFLHPMEPEGSHRHHRRAGIVTALRPNRRFCSQHQRKVAEDRRRYQHQRETMSWIDLEKRQLRKSALRRQATIRAAQGAPKLNLMKGHRGRAGRARAGARPGSAESVRIDLPFWAEDVTSRLYSVGHIEARRVVPDQTGSYVALGVGTTAERAEIFLSADDARVLADALRVAAEEIRRA
jgi:hypothetical protein